MSLKLIETLLYTKSEGLLRLPLHFNRLQNSLKYFNYSVITYETFVFELNEYIKSINNIEDIEELVIKVEVDKLGNLEFSNRPTPNEVPEFVNVVLDTSFTPLTNIEYLINKTTNRAIYNEARKRNGVDGLFNSKFDVILINERDEIMESSIMNVIVKFNDDDDYWYTPALSSGCLPGIKRQELINSGLLKERVINKEEFIQCYKSGGKIELINSIRGRYNIRILFDEDNK